MEVRKPAINSRLHLVTADIAAELDLFLPTAKPSEAVNVVYLGVIMRILLTRISFLFSFSLAFSVSSFSSDLSPQMAQNTLNQFKTLYGAAPLHLNKTLFDVPFYRATPEFLAKYGSSVGIYFRKAVYLHQEQFLTTGINVDSPSVSNVVTHEGWHAYYDQILSRSDRQKIENIWTSY